MTTTEAKKRISVLTSRNKDIELIPDQITGKTFAVRINGHEKGWINTHRYLTPVELLAWLEGVNAVHFLGYSTIH